MIPPSVCSPGGPSQVSPAHSLSTRLTEFQSEIKVLHQTIVPREVRSPVIRPSHTVTAPPYENRNRTPFDFYASSRLTRSDLPALAIGPKPHSTIVIRPINSGGQFLIPLDNARMRETEPVLPAGRYNDDFRMDGG